MVLAGLRPEIIMEIASRALSFWSYQVIFSFSLHSSLWSMTLSSFCLSIHICFLISFSLCSPPLSSPLLSSLQSHQERLYHEYCSTKAKEKLQHTESYYEQIISRTQAELTGMLLGETIIISINLICCLNWLLIQAIMPFTHAVVNEYGC